MSGRPVSKTANTEQLQKLIKVNDVTDNRPLIAYVMRNCGATFTEIGTVFNLSRQQVETIYKNAEAKVEAHEL